MIFKKDFFKKNDFWLLVLLFFLIFLFLYSTRTLFSGYHFIDDHCIISMKKTLESNPFLKTAYLFIKGDLSIRFRPFFYLYYILLTKIFSFNFLVWSIFLGCLGWIVFSLFYLGARRMKFSFLESFLFVVLIFLGMQSAVWWRLGVNEPIGMFFLGLSFYFMTKCLNLNKENYKRNNFLFILFLGLASLCKESFIILIPAFVVFKIWKEKIFFNISFKESAKNNIGSFFLLFLMLIELAIIKFFVGTNKIGYAGLTSSLKEFFLGIKNMFLSPYSLNLWSILVGKNFLLFVVYLLFLFWRKKDKKEIRNLLKEIFPFIVFGFLIIFPEIFMYAKSGMAERYLLPATVGLALLIISLLKNTKSFWFKTAMLWLIFVFLQNQFVFAKNYAEEFAKEGKQANYLFNKVRKESHKQDAILLVADPVKRYEVSHSIKTYLDYYGFVNFYVYPILADYQTDFENRLKNEWLESFKGRMLGDLKNLPEIIIIFDFSDKERFFAESGLEENNYQIVSDEKYPFLILKKISREDENDK